MLVGNFAGISSSYVGQRWNGLFTIVCAVVLSIWVVSYAWISAG
jgi:amino acid permease